jgi:hypothetical protein
MQRHRRALWLIVSIAGIALLTAFLLHHRSSMPSYNGQSLVFWAQEVIQGLNDQQTEEARNAIRVLCTNKVSLLVDWLNYDPWPRAARLHNILGWLPDPLLSKLQQGPLADAKEIRAQTAEAVFLGMGRELAPYSGSAIPRLAAMLDNTNETISTRATVAAGELGTNGFSILLPVAAREDHPRRFDAIATLATMHYVGTNGLPALQVFFKATQATDPRVARIAAQAIGMYHLDAPSAVPCLVSALSNTNAKVRIATIRAIGRFGAQARSAAPSLAPLLHDPGEEIRDETVHTLERIAPDVLTNAPSQ